MSFLGKIMDTMRLNDDEDDDYFLDDDYEDESRRERTFSRSRQLMISMIMRRRSQDFYPAPPTAIRLFRCAAEAEWKFP